MGTGVQSSAQIGQQLLDWRGVGLAVALGLLIGIQRGWVARGEAAGSRIAGIRTFGLLGLAGGLAGALRTSGAIAAIILAASAALLVIGYLRTSRHGQVSATGSIAGLLTLACGFIAATGQPVAASAIAVAIVLLLSLRSQLHRFVGMLTEQEVIAIGRFALFALVIMPILPDGQYGPLQAWNPRQLWLVVVLVSGLSLAGYLGARLLGQSRGLLFTALAGSLVSSTAVTLSVAGQLRAQSPAPLLNAAIALASATMCLRLGVLVAALTRFALPTFVQLVGPALLVSACATAWFLRSARHAAPGNAASAVTVRNPFALAPALLLMVLVMAITLLARWMLIRFGDAGVATVLAISGTFDSDSTVIAMGHLPPGTLAPRLAGAILIVPVVLNSLLKAGVVLTAAGRRNGWPAAATLIATALAALLPLPLVLG